MSEKAQFKGTQEQFKDLLDLESVKSGKSYTQLNKWGGLHSIKKCLKIQNFRRGLTLIDDFDLEQRHKKYGVNYIQKQKLLPKKSFLHYFCQQYQDLIFQFFIGFSIADILFGIWDQGIQKGWIDGLTFIAFTNIMMIGYALVISYKNNQFLKLLEKVNENKCLVIRNGLCFKVPQNEILVGDTVVLDTGDTVPADGILFENQGIICDESYMGQEFVEKGHVEYILESEEDTIEDKKKEKKGNEDSTKNEPFVFSQSKISQGSGKMIVLQVGENSFLGQIYQDLYRDFMDIVTPVQQKLYDLTHVIGQEGLKAIQILFVLMLVMLIFQVYFYADMKFFSVRSLRFFLNQNLIICLLCVMIAIPEGIPLIPYFFKALHIRKMMSSGIIPYNSTAIDNLGQIDTVVLDKTGIITKRDFRVSSLWILDKLFQFGQDSLKEDLTYFSEEIPDNIKNLLFVGLCMNSNSDPVLNQKEIPEDESENDEQEKDQEKSEKQSVFKINLDQEIKIPKTSKNLHQEFEQRGNQTDTALLTFCNMFNYNYKNFRMYEKDQKQGKPFLTNQNIMWTIYLISNNTYRIFVKGSFDYLKGLCQYYLSENGETKPITEEYVEKVFKTVEKLENERQERVIFLACKDLSSEKMRQLEQLPYSELEGEILKDLIILGMVGLENQIQESISNKFDFMQNRLTVKPRMITQDSLSLGIAVARNCGIVDQAKNLNQLTCDYTVMTGEQLEKMVKIQQKKITQKQLQQQNQANKVQNIFNQNDDDEDDEIDEENLTDQQKDELRKQKELQKQQEQEELEQEIITYTIQNPSPRTELLAKNLSVLARANSEHKFILQVLLKYYKINAAFTGQGENDIQIFNEAFLGISCWKQGKSVDKQISDVGLLNDDIQDLISGIIYSRALWSSIKAFCAFYISLTAVTLFVIGWSELFVFQSILNPVHLIIINLILDILAALFYMSDFNFIKKNQISQIPEKIENDLFNSYYKQQIGAQVIVQVLILGFSQIYLEYYYGTNLFFHFSDLENQQNVDQLNGVRHSLFTTIYMYMVIFSIIHFRQITNKKSYFVGIFQNIQNWIIIGLIVVFQTFLINFGRHLNMSFSPLNLDQQIQCLLTGSLSLLVGYATSFIFPKEQEEKQNYAPKKKQMPYLQVGKNRLEELEKQKQQIREREREIEKQKEKELEEERERQKEKEQEQNQNQNQNQNQEFEGKKDQ